ncbi:MAG: hypothetical protein ICV63_04515, partial [Coleofasciculus sp. Co-bin14]|nr:hypothetical protein [Coleofasciculus sp. Co-bin14]
QKQQANNKQWKKAVEEYVNRIQSLLSVPNLKPEQWQRFGEVLEALESVGYNEFNLLAGECFYRAENYEQAVLIWEDCDATQKPEYNLAKARLLGMPEGLDYLEKLEEHGSIISEWEKAGKPRTLHWLPYVAPALETKQQYQQAFVVYIWLDELVKVKECFEKASPETPSIKLMTVLLQYFYRKKRWIDALDAIETYLPKVIGSTRQKIDLKFDFVSAIACSDLTPNELTQEQRKRYEKFLKEQILSTSNWQSYLLMQQVGVSLEKIGLLVETLEFYEQFVSHRDRELCQFARERWIAIKKKQEEYARNQGQMDKASKSHSELLKKADGWGIPPESVPLDPPLAPRERPTPQLSEPTATPVKQSKPPAATKFVIKGLPSATKVEQLGDGVVSFGIRHLVIKVMRQSKQILITDALNGREVRVDGAQCKVHIGEATVEVAGENQLFFALSSSGYDGSLICNDKKPRLELNVQGLPSKISIDL